MTQSDLEERILERCCVALGTPLLVFGIAGYRFTYVPEIQRNRMCLGVTLLAWAAVSAFSR